MLSTYIISLIFTFILFLILLFGKRYYDGIGLTEIEEEEEENEKELSVKYYSYQNTDRSSYFSDEVIDCKETIASSDTCVEIGQDLVTILQRPMNGGKQCTDKTCKNSDIYNCGTIGGRKRGVFIQRRSDNKFLNIDTKPCADESSFVLADGYVFDPPISQEEIDKMTCKDTYIERITVKNPEGKDISWDVILKWEDFNVSGFATLWKLEVSTIQDEPLPNRDTLKIHTILKDSTLGIDKKIYLAPAIGNTGLELNLNIAINRPENKSYFKSHVSEGSSGINLICEEDNTQLIVYKPVHTACTTLGELVSLKFIKRKSDGKYLVVKGPKLLDYYADRGGAPWNEFDMKPQSMAHQRSNVSFHEVCIDGDNYHISYTDDINKATGIIIEKSDTTISLKLEYEVSNFELVNKWNIDHYKDPHKVTKYLELVNGNISLCNNWKYTKWTYQEKNDYVDNKVIGLRPENAPDIPLADAKVFTDWVGTWWSSPDDLICKVDRNPSEYNKDWGYGRFATGWEDPETTCFYGSQDKIDISIDLFEQNYELVESNITMRTGNEPENCKEKTEQEQECEKDYKKCISYDDFYSYHGNLTDYSFGKCVPKTSFLNKLSTDLEGGSQYFKWSPDLADIVTKKCDQSMYCDEGMESSNVFNKNDMTKQFDYLIGKIPSGVHPAGIQAHRYRANYILQNEMKPITYSQACEKIKGPLVVYLPDEYTSP